MSWRILRRQFTFNLNCIHYCNPISHLILIYPHAGFITFDAHIHFYNLNAKLTSPHMLVVSDITDVILPLPEDILVNLADSRAVVESLLDSLPSMFKTSTSTSSCTGMCVPQCLFVLLVVLLFAHTEWLISWSFVRIIRSRTQAFVGVCVFFFAYKIAFVCLICTQAPR